MSEKHLFCRILSKTEKPEQAKSWFSASEEVQAKFLGIRSFETDCRTFLNAFNSSLGSKQLVVSLPALRCTVRGQQLYKPPDQGYYQFWVDFNLGSRSVSLYFVRTEMVEGGSWELETVHQEQVLSL